MKNAITLMSVMLSHSLHQAIDHPEFWNQILQIPTLREFLLASLTDKASHDSETREFIRHAMQSAGIGNDYSLKEKTARSIQIGNEIMQARKRSHCTSLDVTKANVEVKKAKMIQCSSATEPRSQHQHSNNSMLPFRIHSIFLRIIQYLDIRAKLKTSTWGSYFKQVMKDGQAWETLEFDMSLIRTILLIEQRAHKKNWKNIRKGLPLSMGYTTKHTYPKGMLLAKNVHIELTSAESQQQNSDSDSDTTEIIPTPLITVTHWLDTFTQLQNIFIWNINPEHIRDHFLNYRFNLLLRHFKFVRTYPYIHMSNFGIIDPNAPFALTANRNYSPKVFIPDIEAENLARTLRNLNSIDIVHCKTKLTQGEAQFLVEFPFAYKYGKMFKIENLHNFIISEKKVQRAYEDFV